MRKIECKESSLNQKKNFSGIPRRSHLQFYLFTHSAPADVFLSSDPRRKKKKAISKNGFISYSF